MLTLEVYKRDRDADAIAEIHSVFGRMHGTV